MFALHEQIYGKVCRRSALPPDHDALWPQLSRQVAVASIGQVAAIVMKTELIRRTSHQAHKRISFSRRGRCNGLLRGSLNTTRALKTSLILEVQFGLELFVYHPISLKSISVYIFLRSMNDYS